MAKNGNDTNFYLDVKYMDQVIGDVQKLADKTEDMRYEFEKAITAATEGWRGKSRTTFDKKAHVLMQELTDVTDELFEVSEELVASSKAYMEADMQLSKSMDGSTDRY